LRCVRRRGAAAASQDKEGKGGEQRSVLHEGVSGKRDKFQGDAPTALRRARPVLVRKSSGKSSRAARRPGRFDPALAQPGSPRRSQFFLAANRTIFSGSPR
jgi:hypothetical protein